MILQLKDNSYDYESTLYYSIFFLLILPITTFVIANKINPRGVFINMQNGVLIKNKKSKFGFLRDELHLKEVFAVRVKSFNIDAIVKKDLEESGFSQETISGLHSPIGLAIGGQTPEEIALSVISEIVKCKNERTSCTQVDNEVLDALIEASDGKYILCTIIKKNGSAPRGVGTQMLVSSDNRIIGTIGGGCAEAEVISHCRRLFRKQEFKCGLMDVSMNTDDAEKEGMVCGGSISVLLEQIG